MDSNELKSTIAKLRELENNRLYCVNDLEEMRGFDGYRSAKEDLEEAEYKSIKAIPEMMQVIEALEAQAKELEKYNQGLAESVNMVVNTSSLVSYKNYELERKLEVAVTALKVAANVKLDAMEFLELIHIVKQALAQIEGGTVPENKATTTEEGEEDA